MFTPRYTHFQCAVRYLARVCVCASENPAPTAVTASICSRHTVCNAFEYIPNTRCPPFMTKCLEYTHASACVLGQAPRYATRFLWPNNFSPRVMANRVRARVAADRLAICAHTRAFGARNEMQNRFVGLACKNPISATQATTLHTCAHILAGTHWHT